MTRCLAGSAGQTFIASSQVKFITSVGDLKLKFEFPGLKIFCHEQVQNLLKTFLLVAAIGIRKIIYYSLVPIHLQIIIFYSIKLC